MLILCTSLLVGKVAKGCRGAHHKAVHVRLLLRRGRSVLVATTQHTQTHTTTPHNTHNQLDPGWSRLEPHWRQAKKAGTKLARGRSGAREGLEKCWLEQGWDRTGTRLEQDWNRTSFVTRRTNRIRTSFTGTLADQGNNRLKLTCGCAHAHQGKSKHETVALSGLRSS